MKVNWVTHHRTEVVYHGFHLDVKLTVCFGRYLLTAQTGLGLALSVLDNLRKFLS